MPDSRGGKLLSMLPSRVYQPILNQPEDSHTCLACDKTASSRAAGLQFLAAAFGFVGLFLGWYALFGPRAGDCRHDFRREDHFIPTIIYDRTFVEDSQFVNSDPYDGIWNFDGTSAKPTTPWDHIFPGAWIEIAHPAEYGLEGGLPMNKFYQDNVSPESEAYVPSVFHQIHCVGELKHAILESQRGRRLPNYEHIDHCLEYLRQAVICSGDLTLERPYIGDTSWTRNQGWGVVHQCRDLSKLYDFPQANFSSVIST